MPKHNVTTLSVPATVGMTDLLNRPDVVAALHRSFPAIQAVLLQIQLDVTSETNRDTVGPTILALKHVHDVLSLFDAKGRVLVSDQSTK